MEHRAFPTRREGWPFPSERSVGFVGELSLPTTILPVLVNWKWPSMLVAEQKLFSAQQDCSSHFITSKTGVSNNDKIVPVELYTVTFLNSFLLVVSSASRDIIPWSTYVADQINRIAVYRKTSNKPPLELVPPPSNSTPSLR